MFRFTLINHLCTDLNPIMDITRPPDRVRQDVSRSPGGDSRIFLNNCIGCHAAMDPMAQAFAYYNFDGVRDPRDSLYPRRRAGEVPDQTPRTSIKASSRRMTAGAIAGAKGRTRCSAGAPRCRAAATGAKSLGQELAASTAFRAMPGAEGLPGRVLSPHRRTRPIAPRSPPW